MRERCRSKGRAVIRRGNLSFLKTLRKLVLKLQVLHQGQRVGRVEDLVKHPQFLSIERWT
jgi:hypothetical protein